MAATLHPQLFCRHNNKTAVPHRHEVRLSEAAALLRFIKTNLALPFTPIIAGGFARDQILGVKARDIDVFLLTDSCSVDEATREVIDCLNSHFVQNIVEPKVYLTTDGIPAFGPSINFQFLQWPVQIICTPCHSAEEVVESFDYNICQFWLHPSDALTVSLHESIFEALVRREMRLLHTRTPWSSLRRGILMADRFGFNLNEQDKRKLVEALHAEQSA